MSTREAQPSLPSDLMGSSPVMGELLQQIEKVALTEITVLIEGETGSGKSLVAQTLHRLGRRAGRPFVRVDAAGLGEEFFDSELFGYRPGVFPEAPEVREGLAGVADGGTLFFDGVDQLPADSQGKLARFLDSRLVQPLGAAHPRPVDVRILAASKNDLRAEVRAGRFRSDLYYRLRGYLLRVPSLRDRREDLPFLAGQLLTRYATRYGKAIPGISPAALTLLLSHPFEGNLRELESEIEHAVLHAPAGQALPPEALPLTAAASGPGGVGEVPLRQYRRDQERAMVVETLEATRWNVSAAARRLGLSRVGLSKKIKTLGLRRPTFPLGRRRL
ncbi:MAG TPA: sigma-54 dependent transcriptional regulator [Thermoanaerobaculia bacterium]|nr:sigma-54 dependent transcriptional regulator [Thermoanaerobaculia bacterium]